MPAILPSPNPPQPSETWEQERWAESALRRRMLYGRWRKDLNERMVKQLGTKKAEAWGDGDIGCNILLSTCQLLSISHDREPSITHEDQAAADVLAGHMRTAGWSPTMQTMIRDLLGIREMVLWVDVVGTAKAPRVVLIPTFPDQVIAAPHPDLPDVPIMLQRQYRLPDGGWGWERLDVRDPKRPSRKILSADERMDLTAKVLKSTAYPYKRTTGDRAPHLPGVLYHARKTAALWDPWHASEVVEGTLQAAIDFTHFHHLVMRASWKQRYAVGVEAPGTYIDTDPTAILIMQPSSDNQGGAIVSQWDEPGDPRAILDATATYARWVQSLVGGVGASDFARMSGDPRSGYALSISNESRRSMARKIEPCLAAGDEQLLCVVAAGLNRMANLGLPEEGYRVTYNGLPPTTEEIAAEREHAMALLEAGLITRVEAYRRIHKVTDAQARKAIAEIDAERAARAAVA